MKKTYWWRILFMLIGIVGFVYSWLAAYNSSLGLCHLEDGKEQCLISYNSYIDSMAFVSITIVAVSILLFFVNDFVFKKWLKFAIAWFILITILIILAPTSSTSIPGNPTKESISIWMSSLFVIISLIQIIVFSIKQKNK